MKGTVSMTDWQPIETVPKDGTYVILYTCRDGLGRPTVGRWVDIVHTHNGVIAYERHDWDMADSLSLLLPPLTVTHWMAFPPSPLVGG